MDLPKLNVWHEYFVAKETIKKLKIRMSSNEIVSSDDLKLHEELDERIKVFEKEKGIK